MYPNRHRIVGVALAASLALGGMSAMVSCSAPTQDGAGESSGQTDAGPATVSFTDDAGRENTIPSPDHLDKVYCSWPGAQVYLLSLAPEKAAGITTDFSDAQLKYLPANVGGLEKIGSWAHGGTVDTEKLIADGVQLILDVAGSPLSQSDIDSANELQDATGIPVLLFDSSTDKTPDTYRAIGKALGQEEAAEEKASYLEKIHQGVADAVARIPEGKRVPVYYAEGPTGLKTESEDSLHFATYKEAGAKDVAQADDKKGKGLNSVSLENVIAWDPQVIISWSSEYQGGADQLIRSSDDWSSIDAVKNGRVYTIPSLPYMWGDRPASSVMRYIGMQWAANKLYPNEYKVDMVAETKTFYKVILNVDLSDEDARSILFMS